jgi:small basic protein (TIGR04137 family)
MTIDKSLKIKAGSVSNRNVLTRAERYQKLVDDGKWTEESSVLGMPKVRVEKLALGKKKKAKSEDEGETTADANDEEKN